MIKAVGTVDGKPVLFLGLSFGNLKKFMSDPLDTFIRIDAVALGLSHDIIIFSGATEEQMHKAMTPMFRKRAHGRSDDD